jgi:hypothetical protein
MSGRPRNWVERGGRYRARLVVPRTFGPSWTAGRSCGRRWAGTGAAPRTRRYEPCPSMRSMVAASMGCRRSNSTAGSPAVGRHLSARHLRCSPAPRRRPRGRAPGEGAPHQARPAPRRPQRPDALSGESRPIVQVTIGNLGESRRPTTLRKGCGQTSGSPRGDADRSWSPSPPPSGNTGVSAEWRATSCTVVILIRRNPSPGFVALQETQGDTHDLTCGGLAPFAHLPAPEPRERLDQGHMTVMPGCQGGIVEQCKGVPPGAHPPVRGCRVDPRMSCANHAWRMLAKSCLRTSTPSPIWS